MMVAVPMCELLFPTSVYGLYLPRISHSYPCYSLGIIVQTSEYFIINKRSKYLLYYLDALHALRDSVDGQYS